MLSFIKNIGKLTSIILILFLITGCQNYIHAYKPETAENPTEILTEENPETPEISKTSEIYMPEPEEILTAIEITKTTEIITDMPTESDLPKIMPEIPESLEIKPVMAIGETEEEIYEFNIANFKAQGTDNVTLNFYLLPSYEIQSQDKRIIDLAASVTNGITNDYDKAKAIYIWVADNIWKDLDYKNGNEEVMNRRLLENPVDALTVLTSKVGMCVHYTNLTVALLRASGIPAKAVRIGEAGHTFSEAYIDNRWIIMDNYFDGNNQYQYGRIIKTEACGDKFFDITIQDIWDREAYYFKANLDFVYYIKTNGFFGVKSLESVSVPNGFYAIGASAFAACTNLKAIYIPDSVFYIDASAFTACTDLIIYGIAGSYAEEYAKENNIKFEKV